MKNLRTEDQQRVGETLAGKKEEPAPAERSSLKSDKFLPLLQRILLSATKATEIAAQQGDSEGCAFLLSDLMKICDSRLTSAPNMNFMSSPVPQVSLNGSTPHTVSTISTNSTISTITSNGLPHSAQIHHQDSSSSISATPTQTSSLHADMEGTRSGSASASVVIGDHLLSSPGSLPSGVSTHSAQIVSIDFDAAADVEGFLVVGVAADKGSVDRALALDAVKTITAFQPSSALHALSGLPALSSIPEEDSPVDQTVKEQVAPLPPPPSPPVEPVPTPEVVQRKHACEIEAATAPPDYTGIKEVVGDTSAPQDSPHSPDDSSTSSTSTSSTASTPSQTCGSAKSSTASSTSGVSAMVFDNSAPDSASALVSVTAPTARSARTAALQHLGGMLQSGAEVSSGSGSGTAGYDVGLSATVPGPSRITAPPAAVTTTRTTLAGTASATAKSHATKVHSTKKHTDTAAPATATPQLSGLRQMLRESTEQRRKVASAVPRFNNSATSLLFSRQARQQSQQEQKEQQEQRL